MAQQFTINLNGNGCNQLISEVQWMNRSHMAKYLHMQAQKQTCTWFKDTACKPEPLLDFCEW